MAITREIRTKQGLIHQWLIDETTAELEMLCNRAGISTPPEMHLEVRRQQVMVTSLLHQRLFPGTVLSYASTGKPIVTGNDRISISHSGNIVVMMRSEAECGVDIEMIHPRIRKVRHKFLSDAELLLTQDADDQKLTQYWTAKEAMFKVSGSDKVFMRSNIFVHNLQNMEATAQLVDGSQTIGRKIRFDIQNEMMLAWTEEL